MRREHRHGRIGEQSETARRVRSGANRRETQHVSTFLWFLFAVAYLAALVVLGMTTFRKGHTALFWFGILFPFLWIVGALMSPTPKAAAAAARTGL
jgi:bacteriorhodopsin